MAKLETLEGDGSAHQPSGTGQQPPGVVQQPSGVVHQQPGMMYQPYGTVQQQPEMMQQPFGMEQQLPGMMQQQPEVMLLSLPPSFNQITFVQPPQDQPSTPNGTLVKQPEMMQQPYGTVQQQPNMMQQPFGMKQQPLGMMQQQPEVMTQPLPLPPSFNPTTFKQPPQDQPSIPNGTSVLFSASQVLDNLDVGVPWTTGLFDCFQHPTNAIITAYLPCVTFGQIAEVLDEGEMNCALGSYIYLAMMPALCSHWLMGSRYRSKLRRKYHLVEAPFPDMVSHLFCPCCALAQEFRELKNKGLDPSLGWKRISELNMENPPPSQSMTR